MALLLQVLGLAGSRCPIPDTAKHSAELLRLQVQLKAAPSPPVPRGKHVCLPGGPTSLPVPAPRSADSSHIPLSEKTILILPR